MFKHLILGMLVIGTYIPHKDKQRTILLFADKASQKTLKIQQHLLDADKAGLKQRDIEVLVYNPQSSVAKTNHVRGGFTIVLIGKDGGEKLRSHQPVSTKKIFGLIDSMPMRKDEIAHGAYQEE